MPVNPFPIDVAVRFPSRKLLVECDYGGDSFIAETLYRKRRQLIYLDVILCYVCILLDLFNRQIIGYSAGVHKNAELVYDAFATVDADLRNIKMFHTDRGSEFNNSLMDDVITAFDIRRSLSMKGCPYGNAVAEATFKIFKAEFVYGRNFPNLNSLKLELSDYVHWFNHFRLHSSPGYLSPVDFNAKTLTNLSD